MKLTAFVYIAIAILFPVACSKTGNSFPPPPPDPCSMVTLSLNGNTTHPSVHGATDGSINAWATGGSGFSYSLNGGPFQSLGKFNNLAAGNYMVTTKNSDGCSTSVSFVLINPVISCTGVNIIVNSSATTNHLCETATATLTVTATGGVPPYTFCINGGTYQASNIFTNLPTGGYAIEVKDANGCMGSGSTTITNAGAGPLFSQVKTLIRNHCLYCHSSTFAMGGISYSDDCNIIIGKMRIKERAVDGNPTPMPQSGLLPMSERQKIIDWLNAGGHYSN